MNAPTTDIESARKSLKETAKLWHLKKIALVQSGAPREEVVAAEDKCLHTLNILRNL
jgi:hypothetical protein